MWMIIDAATGEIVSDRLADQPAPAEGEEVLPRPGNNGAIWLPAERAWDLSRMAETQQAWDLDLMRATVWDRIKAARERAEYWGCSTPKGRVDTTPDSQRKVSGCVQLAMIAMQQGQAFAIDWTMQDNSVAAHDAPAMITMGVAVGQHVAAVHAVALAKRAELEAALDADAIYAIDVESGWPDAPQPS